MESLDYWRLCDELSVFHAALLIAEQDPSTHSVYAENWDVHERPAGYEATKTALTNAIMGKRLPASIRYSSRLPHYKEDPDFDEEVQRDENGNMLYVKRQLDLNLTTVRLTDLRAWLSSRGLKTGFFFPEPSSTPDYLDATHPNYAPKLAAAIEAWQAVTSTPAMMKAKTAKQAMIKWLRENANRFGLTKDDGNPNEQGIDEIAKIANWDTKGGAPKTPGSE
jgi:hypothetical protein